MLARTGELVPELPAMQTLDAAGIEALEPALGRRFAQGLLLPDEGQLDNRALLAALLATLQALPKVRLHWQAPRTPDDFAPAPPASPSA